MRLYKGNEITREWNFTSKKAFAYILVAVVINYAIWSIATGTWTIVEL
jgi:hypothetical protein